MLILFNGINKEEKPIMDDNCMFNWQSVEALPLFSATIKVVLKETEQQLHFIQHLKNTINNQIDQNSITRIMVFYEKQLEKMMCYDEQLQRWFGYAGKNSNSKVLNDISDLKKSVEIIKKFSCSIIEIAKELYLENGKNPALSVNEKDFN